MAAPSEGVVAGGIWYPTESGLQAPGGILDRLQGAMDARAQYQGTLAGLAPALRGSGIPVATPSPSILSQLTGGIAGLFGLGGQQQAQPPQQQPPQMPIARADLAGGQGASSPTAGAPMGGGGGAQPQMTAGGLSGNALVAYIGQKAQQLGIDPMTALRVAQSEGGFAPATAGDANSSFGPFQLHYGGGSGPNASPGLGDDFTRATGLDARDPRNAAAAIDFALQDASKNGWSKFHGAAKAGIGQWDGISGGTPTGAMAYAPGGAGGDNLMPQATAERPQSSQAMALANSNTPGAAAPSGSNGAPASTASPGQVVSTLMANPATRPLGAKLWQGALAQGGGGMPGTMTLPAGMTPEALAQMISTPQTQAMGLAIWQKSLFPQITSVEPGRAIFRGTQYMGQAPSAPMDVGPGHAVVNPNTGAPIAAVPPELQHTEIGRDPYGQPIYGTFNPRTGATTPFQGGQGQGQGATTGADGQPLSGDAFLGTLPPPLAAQVKAIAEGRVKLPSGMGAANPMAQRMRAAVLQYDPSFDQAGVDARFETRADFAKGDAAKTITAGNTALIHLGELAAQADKLGNADTSLPGNNAYNAVKNYANSSSAAGAPLAAFNATASKYVEEATKFYRGTGGTEGDISRDMLNLSPNMSPTQLKAAIGAQIPLIAGKVAAMQDRWKQGMGPKAGDYPILAPEAQAVLQRLAPQGAPGGAPAQGALPTAAPAGSIPTLTDPSQLQALPPGTRFRTPDGQLRVRH